METEQMFLAICKVNPHNEKDHQFSIHFVNNTLYTIDKIDLIVGGKLVRDGVNLTSSKMERSFDTVQPKSALLLDQTTADLIAFEVYYHFELWIEDKLIRKHFSIHDRVCTLPTLETIPILGCSGLVIAAVEGNEQ